MSLGAIISETAHVDVSGNDLAPGQLLDLLAPLKTAGAATGELEIGGNEVDQSVEDLIALIQAVNPVDIPRDVPSTSAPMTISHGGGGGAVMGGGGVVEDGEVEEMMRRAGWKSGSRAME